LFLERPFPEELIMSTLLHKASDQSINHNVVQKILSRLNMRSMKRRVEFVQPPQRKKILFEGLEPRLLMSADLTPGAVATTVNDTGGLVMFAESGGPLINFAAAGSYQETFISGRDIGNFTSPLVALPPRGSLVYAGGVQGEAGAEVTGSHDIQLDAGQYFSLRLTPVDGDLQAEILVTGPDARTWSMSAVEVNQPLVLNFADGIEAGIYNIQISSLAGSGAYQLDIFLNAGLEEADTSPDFAPDLGLFAIDLSGSGNTRADVVGRIDYTPQGQVWSYFEEQFDTPGLGPNWNVDGWGPGYTGWRADGGEGEGAYAVSQSGFLAMEGGQADDGYGGVVPMDSLHQASLHLDLENVSYAVLEFSERGYDPSAESFSGEPFNGSQNADGLAFSVDGGDVWYPLVNFNSHTYYWDSDWYNIDLVQSAQDWGVTLSADTLLRFQFNDDVWANGGWEYQENGNRIIDNINLNTERAGESLPASVQASGTDFIGSPDLISDSSIPGNYAWSQDGNSVFWEGQAGSLVFNLDLGAPVLLTDLILSVENDDNYVIQSSLDGQNWSYLAQVLPGEGEVDWGMDQLSSIQSDNEFAPSLEFDAVVARHLRIMASGGDGIYAIGEVQAIGQSGEQDYYSLALSAGVPVSLTLTHADAGANDGLLLELLDADGIVQAVGRRDLDTLAGAIENFIPTASGAYFVRVSGVVPGEYNLTATHDLTFAPAGLPAQDITLTHGQALGGFGPFGADSRDYSVNALAGDELGVSVATLAQGNTLAWSIQVFDPEGAEVAMSGDDTYVAAYSGAYTVRILRDSGEGDYRLSVTGFNGAVQLPEFMVVGSSLDGIDRTATFPGWIDLHFNNPILATSLDDFDLTLNGQHVHAPVLLDADSVRWHVIDFFGDDGDYLLELADNAVISSQGVGNGLWQHLFNLDRTGPVANSDLQGQVVATGLTEIGVQFNEALESAGLGGEDLELVRQTTGEILPLDSIAFDPDTNLLTVVFPPLLEDGAYMLRLRSDAGAFRDSVGNLLDGDADGLPGGDYLIHFGVDVGDGDTPNTLAAFQREAPLGSLLYLTEVAGAIQDAGDTDAFVFELPAGPESFSIILTQADPSLKQALELTLFDLNDPLNSPNGEAIWQNAGLPGEGAVSNNWRGLAPGNYRVEVYGGNAAGGSYQLHLLLNALAEEESALQEANNDSLENAQSLDASVLDLGRGASRLMIVGDRHDPLSGMGEPIYNPQNGHYYLLVNDFGGEAAPTWDVARDLAAGSEFRGTLGHLASVTSLAENLFLTDFFGGDVLDGIFLGGYQPPESPEPDGNWQWTNGEWFPQFNNWGPDEPNNFGDEHYTTFAHDVDAEGKQWNDTVIDGGSGYLVEFDGVWQKADDWYKFTAGEGEPISVDVKHLSGNIWDIQVGLYDASGALISEGSWDQSPDGSRVIRDFIPAVEGEYFVRVTGNAAGLYSLVVTKGLDFNVPSSLTWLNPYGQDIGVTDQALGYAGAGALVRANEYLFSAEADQFIEFQTELPTQSLGNTLDAQIFIYDSLGNLVAQDQNGLDGQNALASFTAVTSGVYRVVVSSENGSGEYLLRANTDVSPAEGAPTLWWTFPYQGQSTGLPTSIEIILYQAVDASSLDVSDLMIDWGTVDSVELNGGNRVMFIITPNAEMGEGEYAFTLVNNAFVGLNGQAGPDFGGDYSVAFTVDLTGPEVMQAQSNGELPLNRIDFFFNEEIAEWSVDIEDVQSFYSPFGVDLLGQVNNISVTQEWVEDGEIGYWRGVVSVYFDDQPLDGVYEMTLGPDIQDYAGNAMVGTYTARVGTELGNLAVSGVQLFDPDTLLPIASAAIDSYIYVSWTGQNLGSATLDPYGYGWYDRIWLSTDAVLDTSFDISLNDQWSYGPLFGGSSYDQSYIYVSLSHYSIPAGGTYYLIVETDTYDSLAEGDETDNWMAVPIELTVPETPDFTVSDVTFTPASVEQGSSNITVNWTLNNQGSVGFNSYLYTAIFLSDDAVWDDGDTNLSTTYSYPYLDVGASLPMSRTVTLPMTASGDKYVIVVADYYDYAYEGAGEGGYAGNNHAASATALHIVAPTDDLSVQSFTLLDPAADNLHFGDFIDLNWVVENIGSGDATHTWYDNVYLSRDAFWDAGDLYLSQQYVNEAPLSPGETYTRNGLNYHLPLNASWSDGTYYLLLKVDANGNELESNENNNLASIQVDISMPALANLVVSNVVTPLLFEQGKPFQVNWTLENIGAGAATGFNGSWYDSVYLSPDEIFGNGNEIYIGQTYNNQTITAGASLDRSLTVTPSVTLGQSYFVFVQADNSGNVYEGMDGGENDNVGGSAGSVLHKLPGEDLVIDSVTAPADVVLGQSFNVAWTGSNAGETSTAFNWYDRVILSRDDVYGNADDVYLNETWVSGAPLPLDAGETYSRNLNVSIPLNDSYMEGVYHLFVLADIYNSEPESNNGNNVSAAFQINASLPPLPDMVVSKVIAPEAAESGTSITVNWTVTNQGDGASTRGYWYDLIVLSDDPIWDGGDTWLNANGSAYIYYGGNLAAGASVNRTATVVLPAGLTADKYILVKTNFNGDVYEHGADKDNNARANDWNEDGEPDLSHIVLPDENLDVTVFNVPSSAIFGNTVDLNWTVKNIGSGATAATAWYDQIWLSADQTLNTSSDYNLGAVYRSGGLAATAEYTASQTFSLPLSPSFVAGTYYFFVKTDANGNAPETSEADNVEMSGPVTITVPPVPNITISNVAFEPASTYTDRDVEITFTVNNLGTDPTSSNFYNRVWLSTDQNLSTSSDVLLTEMLFDQVLGNGDHVDLSVTVHLPIARFGNWYVLVQGDHYNQINEYSGENDNLGVSANRLVATLPPLADLSITNNDIVAPTSAIAGQIVPVSWTITNNGDAPASNWTDQIYLSSDSSIGSDSPYGTFAFNGVLNPGESVTRTQNITLPANQQGDRYIVVYTDSYNVLYEELENNNNAIDQQKMAVVLPPLPNLQVESVTAPDQAFSGQQTVVEWVVTNAGTGDTSVPTWYDYVYLSSDGVLDATDTYLGYAVNPSYLAVGDSYASQLAVTLPQGIQGNYSIIVKTDGQFGSNGAVFENTLEGDNSNSDSLSVNLTPPPDLEVTAIAAADSLSGQPLLVGWTVTNDGEGSTRVGSWYDRIHFSTDAVLDAGDTYLGQAWHNGVLAAGGQYNASTTVNLPIGLAGEFFILVSTDVYDSVYEHASESNNTLSEGIVVSLTPPPDLEGVILDLPVTARSGGKLTIDYRVDNYGATSTPNAYWSDRFWLSTDATFNAGVDTLLGSVAHWGALADGDGYEATAQFDLSNALTGNFYVFMTTDADNLVFELDNANNTTRSLGMVSIASTPANLVVSAVDLPSSAEAGKQLVLSWMVSNLGSGDSIVTSWQDRIGLSSDGVFGDDDDIVLGHVQHSGLLGVGGSYIGNANITIPFSVVGNYTLYVLADVNNQVHEGVDEQDNDISSAIGITRVTPDLLPLPGVLPAAVTGGETLTVTWHVDNQGANQTNAFSWYDDVWLSLDTTLNTASDIYLGSFHRNHALAGSEGYDASLSKTLPVAIASGDYHLLVRSDRDNVVIEGDGEANNLGISANTIAITSGTVLVPDLRVSSVLAPASGISGQPVEVSWTVTNDGDATAANWYDSIYLSADPFFDRSSDTYLGYRSHVGGLASGASYSETHSFNLPAGYPGLYYVFVETDNGRSVSESDEFDNAAYDSELLNVQLALPADLTVGTITVPANATPGLNANIQYTIHNNSDNAAIGSWKDSIYLSSDAVWDVDDVLFASVQKSHSVVAHGSYSESVTSELPGLTPGSYHIIIRSDILNQLPESNNANNIGASLDVAAVDVQSLTLGVAANGVLTQGKAVFYKVEVGAGETLVVNLDAASDAGANELYIRYGDMPSRSEYDQSYPEAFSADQRIIVPSTRAGTYYIMAYASEGSSAFSLEASVLEFSIQDIAPVQGSNQGQVTVTLEGAKFPVNGEVSLLAEDGSTLLTASRVWWVDSSTLWATFDLRGVATGVYDIRIEGDGQMTQASDAFTVNDKPAGELKIDLQVPSSLRPSSNGTVVIEYVNDGDTDIVAPLIGLTADYASFKAPDASTFGGNSLQFYAINREGPAGILTPGARGSIQVAFMPSIGDGRVSFSAFAVGGDIPIDWEALQDAYRPAHVEADAWDVLWEEFKTSIGDTFTDYMAVMADNASHLSALGRYVDDLGMLLQFELLQVGAGLPKTLLESATDLSLAAPGQDLVFTRYYDGSLIGRNQEGSLGWGWNSFWDMRATTDSAGNVSILTMDGMRAFLRQADGSYIGAGGEPASLALVGGGYRMTEADGTQLIFRPDGRLDALQDLTGNLIDVTYDAAGAMTGLVAGAQSFSFAYDGDGRISEVSDSAGRAVTYGYDAEGHLTSVNGPAGTTTYGYDTLGASRSQLHALTSVTSAAGVILTYQYDSHGRLIREATAGSEIVDYSYGSAAETMMEIDATGFVTRMMYNDLGRLARVSNSAGQTSAFNYDVQGNLTDYAIQNLLYGNRYDAAGNLISSEDPLGNERGFSYGANDRLTAITDANGNSTQYAYDAEGNLSRVTYADGSHVDYGYDGAGNVTTMTNARGQVTQYAYDTAGRVTQRTLDDASHVDFLYDAAGNLITVNGYDSLGTLEETHGFTYDAAGRMTQANYPDGRSLSYTYDADGRRTSITDQDGNQVNYTYDSAGRLVRAADAADATLAAFSYDSAGRLVEKLLGNGVRAGYTYDAGGLLESITHSDASAAVLSFFDYEYDLLGRPVSVLTESGTWDYEYSATGRLTGAVFSSTDAGVPSRSLSYDYDGEGNRISVTEDGVTAVYSVNALNQYDSVGGLAYTYDADGNLLSDGVTTYAYDSLGRLISASNVDDSMALDYNALGLLVGVADDGVWTRYLVDANGQPNPVASYDADGNPLASYHYALGLLGQDTAAGSSYFGFDFTGNVVNVFDATGGEASAYLLEPFGDRLYGSESIGSPFDFVGQSGILSDSELNLSAMRARVYDADTGRFLSRDPVGYLGGINVYDYVGGAPTYLIDPTGLWYISIGVSGGFGGGGGGAIQIGSNGIYFQGAAGATTPGVGVGITFSPDGNPSPGGGASIQGAVGPGVVGVAGAVNFDGNGYAGTEVGVGIGLGGSKATGAAAFGTYTWPIWEWNPQRPPNPNPGPQPGGPGSNGGTNIVRPRDPNDILGPVGYGDENWIPAGDTYAYTIRFENAPDATAPAQQVVVTQQLDADLDWRTFRVDDFGFGDFRQELAADKAFFSQTLDLSESHGFLLRAVVNIDTVSGVATWTLTTWDPETGEVPEDASIGFLPPNWDPVNEVEDGRGDGFVSYTIKAKRDADTGDVVDAAATIVFDTEGPIDTPPIFNTLDADVPSSSVAALPASSLEPDFLVKWSGDDGENGSGLAAFNLFVSDNGGDFSLWLENSTLTEAEFSGEAGHIYAFYSVARDNAGNQEKAPATPDAQIEIYQLNTAPVAVDDEYTVHAGQVLTIAAPGLLGNDTDADGDALHAVSIEAPELAGGIVALIDGSFEFTPTPGFVGDTGFNYNISDGRGGTANAHVTIHVTNTAPVAVEDEYTVHAGQVLTIAAPGLLGNDTDADGDALHAVSIEAPELAGGIVALIDGSFEFTPTPGFVGDTGFNYNISDGRGGTANAHVTIHVTNTAPVAVEDEYTVHAGQVLTIAAPGLLGNDTDADGDALHAVSIEAPELAGGIVALIDGSFEFTPTPGFVGDTGFNYNIADGHGGTANAHVTIHVTNTAPVADDIDVVVMEGGSVLITLSGNDADGDALSFSILTPPSQGSLGTLDPLTHQLTFTTLTDFYGLDGFTFLVEDGLGGSHVGSVSIDIVGTNDAPVLQPIANQMMVAGETLTLQLFADDIDGDSLSYSLISGTAGMEVDPISGLFTWTGPYLNVAATLPVTVQVSDGQDIAEQSFEIVLDPNLLRVSSIESSDNGVHVRFNQVIDASVLNLYDQGGAFGAADVIVKKGNIVITGSLVMDADGQGFTWLRSDTNFGGGDYSLTLAGRLNGLIDMQGRELDGDVDGVAGGDYVHAFSIASPAADAILGVSEFARGPGQIASPSATGQGFTIGLNRGQGASEIAFVLEYNPALLDVSDVRLAGGVPSGSTLQYDLGTPGRIVIQLQLAAPLADNLWHGLVTVRGSVPVDASYGSAHILHLSEMSLNAGSIPVRGNDGLHVVAYLGDADGDRALSLDDASLIRTLIRKENTGFGAYRLLDPMLIADIDRDGVLDRDDSAAVSLEARGFDQIEIPPIPVLPLSSALRIAPVSEPTAPTAAPTVNFNGGLLDFGIGGSVNDTDWLSKLGGGWREAGE
jgi:RHS repeat-associated protein